jgi:hypothetical protein
MVWRRPSRKATSLPASTCGCTDALRWAWLWLPLTLFTVLLLLALRVDSDPGYINRPWADYFSPGNEQIGVVELATPVFSTFAVIAGIAALRHIGAVSRRAGSRAG